MGQQVIWNGTLMTMTPGRARRVTLEPRRDLLVQDPVPPVLIENLRDRDRHGQVRPLPVVGPTHRPRTCFWPSQSIPTAR
jgi:hypothetical protein